MTQEKFNELVDELIKASELYYHDQKNSFLTDQEYDAKLAFLEQEVTKNPELKNDKVVALLEKVASGTQKIDNSTQTDTNLETVSKKINHIKPMLSLNKANTEAEIVDFLNKTAQYGAKENGWSAQAKLDGLAIAARYRGGKLVQLVTRGNGEVGEDISKQIAFYKMGIRHIDGLPLELKGELFSANIELRGEIFMTDEQFDFLNATKMEEFEKANQSRKLLGKKEKLWEDEKLKTSRNATAGLLNQEISAELKEFQKITSLYRTAKERDGKLDIEKLDVKKYTELKSLIKNLLKPGNEVFPITPRTSQIISQSKTLKPEDSFVAIDFETANGDKRSATEVGAVLVENGKIIDEFHEFIKLPNDVEWPKFPKGSDNRPPFANYMAGKNVVAAYKMSKKNGVSWKIVGEKLKNFCQDRLLVAHGASFDKDVLHSLNKHYGINFFPNFVDTLENAKQTLGEEVENGNLAGLKLKDLALYFNITTNDEYKKKGHTAIFDAFLCAKVLCKLSTSSPIKSQKTAEEKFNERVLNLLYKLKSPSKMSFLCYGVVDSGENNKHVSAVIANLKIDDSSKYGFKDVISETKINLGSKTSSTSENELLEIIRKFGEKRQKGQINLPTDGMVIKCVDDKRITDEMGYTAHHPLSQIAFKYPPSSTQAKVCQILTDVGRTGRLSFKARICQIDSLTEEGVVLDGVTIKYATLHNYDWLSERDVRVGSIIQVVRANDVIPYVETVISNPENSVPFPEPDICPICEQKIDKSTLLFRCPNEECFSRGQGALQVALSRKYLNVENLSLETIDCLVNEKLVHDLADVFLLTQEQLANLKVNSKSEDTDKFRESQKKGQTYDMNMYFGEVRAKKVYQSILQAKNAPLHKILASLNIRLLGLEVAKNLVASFKTIDSLLAADITALEQVELVSETKSKIFKEGLAMKKPLIEKLKMAGFVNLQKKDDDLESEQKTRAEQPLVGQIVVLSGGFPGMNRDDAREFIESLGAKTSGSVSSKTTLLITDPSSNSSKTLKAKELGVENITCV